MINLIIIRGASSSGKSTLAKKLCVEYGQRQELLHHFEADMWFLRGDGILSPQYQFDPMELQSAHTWCRLSAELSIRQGYSVVVSNTFTRRNEVRPYIEIALRYQVPLEIIETSTEWCRDPFECARRNVHGLSVETIQKQLARWEHVIPKVYEGKALEKLLRECSK